MATGATYQDRKLASIEHAECSYPGCRRAQADDSAMCVKHRDAERSRKAAWIKKERKKAKRKNLCTRCTKRRRSAGSSWGCSKCLVELRKIPSRSKVVATHVDKSARIAARTTVGSFAGEEGRSRYRGAQGRRGAPGSAVEDERDFSEVIKKLEKTRAELRYAYSPEVQELPTMQRREVLRAALSHADHGARFIDSILERHRYGGRMPSRDEDDGD